MPAAACASKRLCGLAVLLDDGRAMLVKPHFDAEFAEKDAVLRGRAEDDDFYRPEATHFLQKKFNLDTGKTYPKVPASSPR
jgi:hypothetical protein